MLRKLLILQELIFQSTIMGKTNWIRFPKDSKFHIDVGRGLIPGISLEHIIVNGDMCEVKV